MAAEKKKEEKKSMIIVVPSCLKAADGARTRSDQKFLRRSGRKCGGGCVGVGG